MPDIAGDKADNASRDGDFKKFFIFRIGQSKTEGLCGYGDSGCFYFINKICRKCFVKLKFFILQNPPVFINDSCVMAQYNIPSGYKTHDLAGRTMWV